VMDLEVNCSRLWEEDSPERPTALCDRRTSHGRGWMSSRSRSCPRQVARPLMRGRSRDARGRRASPPPQRRALEDWPRHEENEAFDSDASDQAQGVLELVPAHRAAEGEEEAMSRSERRALQRGLASPRRAASGPSGSAFLSDSREPPQLCREGGISIEEFLRRARSGADAREAEEEQEQEQAQEQEQDGRFTRHRSSRRPSTPPAMAQRARQAVWSSGTPEAAPPRRQPKPEVEQCHKSRFFGPWGRNGPAARLREDPTGGDRWSE
ncbi:unnamed protein product, partial [Polarella glacialis]